MISVSLIGYGYWGKNIAKVVFNSQNMYLDAIVDISQENQNNAKNTYPNIKTYSCLDDLLGLNNKTVVIIATPVHTHYLIVKECLERGHHVLCEKILSTNKNEIQQLYDIADKNNLILEVGYTFLYNSAVDYIKKSIESKELGNIVYLTFKRTGYGPIRQDVNVILDLTAHDISMLIYWIGIPDWAIASEIFCLSKTKSDAAFIQLGYNNGLIVNIHCSWITPIKQRVVEINGTKGIIIFDDVSTSEKIKKIYTNEEYFSKTKDFGSFQLSIKAGDIHVPNIEYKEPLFNEVNAYINKVIKIDEGKSKSNNKSRLLSINIQMVFEAINLSIKNNSSKVCINH